MKKTLIASWLLALATAWVYASNWNFNIKEAIITTELTKWEIITKNISENVENPENKNLTYEIKSGLTENFSYDENTKTITTKETLPVWEYEIDYEVCEEVENLDKLLPAKDENYIYLPDVLIEDEE